MTRRRAPTAPSGADTAIPARARDVVARAILAATHYLEIRAGRRPASHLDDWVDDVVARQVRGLVRRRRHRRGGAMALTVRRLWVSRTEGMVNVVVVLDDDDRLRPVTLAVTTTGDGPVITAIGLPDDHRIRSTEPPGPLAATPRPPHPEALPPATTPPTRLVGDRPRVNPDAPRG